MKDKVFEYKTKRTQRTDRCYKKVEYQERQEENARKRQRTLTGWVIPSQPSSNTSQSRNESPEIVNLEVCFDFVFHTLCKDKFKNKMKYEMFMLF